MLLNWLLFHDFNVFLFFFFNETRQTKWIVMFLRRLIQFMRKIMELKQKNVWLDMNLIDHVLFFIKNILFNCLFAWFGIFMLSMRYVISMRLYRVLKYIRKWYHNINNAFFPRSPSHQILFVLFLFVVHKWNFLYCKEMIFFCARTNKVQKTERINEVQKRNWHWMKLQTKKKFDCGIRTNELTSF